MWPIVGHERAVTFLQGALQSGRLAHAYLLVGPPHIGKGILAQTLAQAVNCREPAGPCLECASCRRIAEGHHADVQVLSLEGEEDHRKEISIDQVREWERLASLRSYEGRYRVFILDGAQHLSPPAANAILKTLEEPPPQVLFVLLATAEDRLLPTIRSRCQRLEMGPLPRPLVAKALQEKWLVAAEKATFLAGLSQGLLGWAVRAAQEGRVLQERASRLEQIASLPQVGWGPRFALAAEVASLFARSREKAREFFNLWLGWWRDLLLIKAGASHLIVNVDYKERLLEQAGAFGLAEVRRFIRQLWAVREQLELNVNARLALEALMLSLPRPRVRAG